MFCDETTVGGGWLVFQKRLDGSVDFYRGLIEYKHGFGSLTGEFWLGLDKIHRLNRSGNYKLEDFAGNTSHAEFDLFEVASEREKYKLSVGTYTGLNFYDPLQQASQLERIRLNLSTNTLARVIQITTRRARTEEKRTCLQFLENVARDLSVCQRLGDLWDGDVVTFRLPVVTSGCLTPLLKTRLPRKVARDS